MRSDSKEVRTQVYYHINAYIDPSDYNCDTLHEAVVCQLDAMTERRDITPYRTAKRWVEGGAFECYYDDVRAFVNSLNLNNSGKRTFSNDEVWAMYVHLLARELEKIYNEKED